MATACESRQFAMVAVAVPSAPRPSADAETPRLGHGHAGRILDILNNRENT
ncbi:hypothetical protein SAZ11_45305 [Streptomyces sp. FXJ1.4098]|nr:hypothetical protein [Streptomyces sp. FXJ1.4098]